MYHSSFYWKQERSSQLATILLLADWEPSPSLFSFTVCVRMHKRWQKNLWWENFRLILFLGEKFVRNRGYNRMHDAAVMIFWTLIISLSSAGVCEVVDDIFIRFIHIVILFEFCLYNFSLSSTSVITVCRQWLVKWTHMQLQFNFSLKRVPVVLANAVQVTERLIQWCETD
jgi:hypothetical protein